MYRLKRARSYAEGHTDSIRLTDPDVNLPIEACTEYDAEDAIRLRFRSAHKSCSYFTHIQFDSTQVMAWYCICTAGSQTMGCCSHIAAAIWFLSFELHQATTNQQPSSTNTKMIQYANDIPDFEASSADEENYYLYTLA